VEQDHRRWINHSPAIAGDTLYVGNYTGTFELTALNARTGAFKWNAPTGGYLDWNTPAVADGVVYASSVDGEAYAFDAATGAPLWQRTFPGLVEASPAVANGVVYVGAYDHYLYALDAATGASRWRAPTGNLIVGTATWRTAWCTSGRRTTTSTGSTPNRGRSSGTSPSAGQSSSASRS
jgi:eukaryotic-like serine/threonine-protein kinase